MWGTRAAWMRPLVQTVPATPTQDTYTFYTKHTKLWVYNFFNDTKDRFEST